MRFEMCMVHWREAGRLWEDGNEWVSQLVTRQGLKLPFTSTSATSNYNLAEFRFWCKSRCLTLVINVVVRVMVKPSIQCTPESIKTQFSAKVHAAYNLPCAKWSLLHLKEVSFKLYVLPPSNFHRFLHKSPLMCLIGGFIRRQWLPFPPSCLPFMFKLHFLRSDVWYLALGMPPKQIGKI